MKRQILIAAGVIAIFALCAQAELITIGLQAVVTDVDDQSNWLEGKVQVNDPIAGYYTYESTTLDSNPTTTVGDYWHTSEPYGIYLNAAELVFQTDPANVNFLVEIINNHGSNEYDSCLIRSYNNLYVNNDVVVDTLEWDIDDYSGSAISSTDLPTTAPVLSNWQFNSLKISGGTKSATTQEFMITGHVTFVELVPEPASLVLLALGAFVLRKKI